MARKATGEYVDEDVEASLGGGVMGDRGTPPQAGYPALRRVVLFQYRLYDGDLDGLSAEKDIAGRLENMDTLVAIVADVIDRRNIAATQIKILDTVSTFAVTPARFPYRCGFSCETITVTIRDPDENLDYKEVEAFRSSRS